MNRAGSNIIVIAVIGVVAACTTPALRNLPPTLIVGNDILAGTELAKMVGTTQNAYSAVERLRPMFLVTRPGSVVLRATPSRIHVFINGYLAGDLDVLRTIPVASVESIRRIQATEAFTQYGEIHAGDGVLMIRVR